MQNKNSAKKTSLQNFQINELNLHTYKMKECFAMLIGQFINSLYMIGQLLEPALFIGETTPNSQEYRFNETTLITYELCSTL